jgi:superfamily I DNA/RNA helicase
MSEDFSEIFEKFKTMVDNDTIPDNVKEVLNNINSNNNENETTNSSNSLNDLLKMFSSNNKTEEKASNSTNNIDIETILKMKSIMEKMNSKDDPRSSLLLSLKPYLKESRKNKIEQYIQLFNMSKVVDVFKPTGGDSKK